MKSWLSRIIFIFAAASVLSEVSIANSISGGDADKSWKFRVWLDDTPIGYHQVSINKEENRKTVHTQAKFDVRFLFVPVYSYSHETRELWEDGCLVNITSTTDDNGDDYFISTMQKDGAACAANTGWYDITKRLCSHLCLLGYRAIEERTFVEYSNGRI